MFSCQKRMKAHIDYLIHMINYLMQASADLKLQLPHMAYRLTDALFFLTHEGSFFPALLCSSCVSNQVTRAAHCDFPRPLPTTRQFVMFLDRFRLKCG
jgi:hypothetical protein